MHYITVTKLPNRYSLCKAKQKETIKGLSDLIRFNALPHFLQKKNPFKSQ